MQNEERTLQESTRYCTDRNGGARKKPETRHSRTYQLDVDSGRYRPTSERDNHCLALAEYQSSVEYAAEQIRELNDVVYQLQGTMDVTHRENRHTQESILRMLLEQNDNIMSCNMQIVDDLAENRKLLTKVFSENNELMKVCLGEYRTSTIEMREAIQILRKEISEKQNKSSKSFSQNLRQRSVDVPIAQSELNRHDTQTEHNCFQTGVDRNATHVAHVISDGQYARHFEQSASQPECLDDQMMDNQWGQCLFNVNVAQQGNLVNGESGTQQQRNVMTSPAQQGNSMGASTPQRNVMTSPAQQGNLMGASTPQRNVMTSPAQQGNSMGASTPQRNVMTTPSQQGNSMGASTPQRNVMTTPSQQEGSMATSTQRGIFTSVHNEQSHSKKNESTDDVEMAASESFVHSRDRRPEEGKRKERKTIKVPTNGKGKRQRRKISRDKEEDDTKSTMPQVNRASKEMDTAREKTEECVCRDRQTTEEHPSRSDQDNTDVKEKYKQDSVTYKKTTESDDAIGKIKESTKDDKNGESIEDRGNEDSVEDRGNEDSVEDRENEDRVEDRENEDSVEDRENEDSVEDRENRESVEDRENEDSIEDRENEDSIEDRENENSIEDRENEDSIEDRENRESVEDRENEDSVEDMGNEDSVEDRENEDSIVDTDNGDSTAVKKKRKYNTGYYKNLKFSDFLPWFMIMILIALLFISNVSYTNLMLVI